MITHRKLAAILSADAVGYSRLMADDEAATLRSLNEARGLFRERIQAHGGRLIDTAGDSILAEFPSAVEAVDCAVEIQHELAKRNSQLAEHRRMQFRIGINLGDVIEQEDGTIYGDGVNVAARLQQLEEPGGIRVSGTAFDHVEGKLALAFKFFGEQQVKNIAKPVRAYRVLTDAPASKSQLAGRVQRRVFAAGTVAIITILVAAGITWRLQQSGEKQHSPSQDLALAMPSGPSIAVLAFENMSGDPGQDYFADGISEEIIAGLSRFLNLRVIARNSTFQYKGRATDVRQIGRELGADYVVEGSVRRASNTVRVTAQLLETNNGSHVWAETYERRLDPENLFAVQDDITSQVVSRIGDVRGAVNRARIQKLRAKNLASLEDYECVLLAYEYQRFLTPDKHANVKACLVHTVERNPSYAEAWANLAYTYADQYWGEYDGPPDPLEKAQAAAERAVELDQASPIAHFSLANVYFFRNDLDRFFAEAERALALNPNNTEIIAALAFRLSFAGKQERGLALIRKAIALNPAHPGWYRNPFILQHLRKREYAAALEAARRVDMPGFWWARVWLAVTYAKVGQTDSARREMKEALKLNPVFEHDPLRYIRMWFKSESDVQLMADGLRKAGLQVPDKKI